MRRLVLSLAVFSYPVFAELTVSQIEEMVKRIQSKRVSEYEIDFLEIPSPLEGIANVVEDNKSKTILLDNVKDISFTLNAVINDYAYINGKWYRRGNSVHGFILREIFDDHVILKKERKKVKVYLIKNKDLKIEVTGDKK